MVCLAEKELRVVLVKRWSGGRRDMYLRGGNKWCEFAQLVLFGVA